MPVDWLITGAGGQLGSVLFRELLHRGEAVIGTLSTRGPQPPFGQTVRIDITDLRALGDVVRTVKPRFIIHTAAITSIDAAWRDPDKAGRTNVSATVELARLSGELNTRLVFLSTDLVFNGTAAPYQESDPTTPLSVYGRTKAEAEQAVLTVGNGLVIRPALMYGLPAVDRPTTFRGQLEALRTGQPLKLFEDEYRTPLWLEDAVRACLEAAKSGLTGILHIAGPERLSRLEMGRLMARAFGLNEDNIVAIRQRDLQTPEMRPVDVSLDCRLFSKHFGHPPGRPMAQAMLEIVSAIGGA